MADSVTRGDLTALNSAVVLNVAGFSTYDVDIRGTFTGTITLQGTINVNLSAAGTVRANVQGFTAP